MRTMTQLPTMKLDRRATNIETHTHATIFGGKKGETSARRLQH